MGKPKVAYREAITTAGAQRRPVHPPDSGGRGQYGHVWLQIEPRDRGVRALCSRIVLRGVESIPKEYILVYPRQG